MERRGRAAWLGAAAAVLLAAGCDSPIVDDYPMVNVRGTVLTAGGTPVAGADVTVAVRGASCIPEPGFSRTLDARTDGQGEFRARYSDTGFSGCLSVHVAPPASSSLPAETVVLRDVVGTPKGDDTEVVVQVVLGAG